MTDTAAAESPRRELVPLKGGGQVVAIIPQSVEEVFRLANAIHKSDLAPKTLNTVEKVTVAIMAGAELGLAPFQAVQSFYVVNGRPTLWGDAVPALLWASGFKIKEWATGSITGEDYCAHCEITRPGGDVIPGEFSHEDAVAAKLLGKDGPWQTARKRMYKMRARAFAARDGASDVLKGFKIAEEVQDYEPTREDGAPVLSGIAQRLAEHGHAQENGFKETAVDDGLGIKQNPATPEQVHETAAEAEFEDVADCTHDWKPEEDEPQCLICRNCGMVHDLATGPAPTVGESADDERETAPDSWQPEADPHDSPGAAPDLFPGDRPASTAAPAGAAVDPEDWAIRFNGLVDACTSDKMVAALLVDPENVAAFEALTKAKPAMATALNGAITAKRAALTKGAK
jgi:hypothetical protein